MYTVNTNQNSPAFREIASAYPLTTQSNDLSSTVNSEINQTKKPTIAEQEQHIFFHSKEGNETNQLSKPLSNQPLKLPQHCLASKQEFERFVKDNQIEEAYKQAIAYVKEFKDLIVDYIESETLHIKFINYIHTIINSADYSKNVLKNDNLYNFFSMTRSSLNKINNFLHEIKQITTSENKIIFSVKLLAEIINKNLTDDFGECIAGFDLRISNLYSDIGSLVSGISGLLEQNKKELIMVLVDRFNNQLINSGITFESEAMDIHNKIAVWNKLADVANFLNISTKADSAAHDLKLDKNTQQDLINQAEASVSPANIIRRITDKEFDSLRNIASSYNASELFSSGVNIKNLQGENNFFPDIDQFIKHFNSKYTLNTKNQLTTTYLYTITWDETTEEEIYKIEHLYDKLQQAIVEAVLHSIPLRHLINIPSQQVASYDDLEIQARGNSYFYIANNNNKNEKYPLQLKHLTYGMLINMDKSTYRALIEQALIQTPKNDAMEIIKFFNDPDISNFLKQDDVLMISLNNIISNKLATNKELEWELKDKIIYDDSFVSPQNQLVIDKCYWLFNNDLIKILKDFTDSKIDCSDSINKLNCQQLYTLGSDNFIYITTQINKRNTGLISRPHFINLFFDLLHKGDSPLLATLISSNIIDELLQTELALPLMCLPSDHHQTMLILLAKHEKSSQNISEFLEKTPNNIALLSNYLNHRDANGKTALIYAAEIGNTAFLDAIKQNKDLIDIIKLPISNDNVIKYAIKNGRSSFVAKLFDIFGGFILGSRMQRNIPLEIAAFYGKLNCLKIIYEKKAPRYDIYYNISPFTAAAENGHINCIEYLLSNLDNISLVNTQEKILRSTNIKENIILIAAKNGHSNFLIRLSEMLEKKARFWYFFRSKEMQKIIKLALEKAFENNNIQCVKFLVEHHKLALVYKMDSGISNLMQYARSGEIDKIRQLQTYEDLFDVNQQYGENKDNALTLAAQVNQVGSLTALKTYQNLDFYAQNKNGYALTVAIQHNSSNCAEILLTGFYNRETHREQDKKVLMQALEYINLLNNNDLQMFMKNINKFFDDIDVIRVILKFAIQTKNELIFKILSNATLMLAVENKDIPTIQMLYKVETLDPLVRNSKGYCALTFAVQNNFSDLIEPLAPLYNKGNLALKAVIFEAKKLAIETKNNNCIIQLNKYFNDQNDLPLKLKQAIVKNDSTEEETSFKNLIDKHGNNEAINIEEKQSLFNIATITESFNNLLVLIKYFNMESYINLNGNSAMMAVVMHGNIEILNMFCQHHKLIDTLSLLNNDRDTALMLAVKNENKEAVRKLVDYKDKIGASLCNKKGESALVIATKNKSYEILQQLACLYNEEDKDQQEEIHKAYLAALINRDSVCINFFRDNYNLNRKTVSFEDFGSFSTATKDIENKCAEIFNSKSFEINKKTDNGRTMLMEFIEKRPDLISNILKANMDHIKNLTTNKEEYKHLMIDLSIRDNDGRSITDQILQMFSEPLVPYIVQEYRNIIESITEYKFFIARITNN